MNWKKGMQNSYRDTVPQPEYNWRSDKYSRMDVLLSEKEKLGDNLTTKDKKLVDLENR